MGAFEITFNEEPFACVVRLRDCLRYLPEYSHLFELG